MTDSLSLNTNLLSGNNYSAGTGIQPFSAPTTASGSLFSPIQSNSSAYTNDFMMSGLDFDSLAYDPQTGSIFQQKPAQNPQPQAQALPQLNNNAGVQTFTSAPVAQQNPQQQVVPQNSNGQPNLSELDNYLVKDDNAKPQTPSNICKKAGAAVGFLAPVAERVWAGLKSGSVIKALNLKQLAVTCPIIALAGYGIGYLADGIISSIKGNKNSTPAAQPVPQVQQQNAPQQIAQQQYQPMQIAA